jgi:ribosomal-protein-alanine N-acetyltransferase
LKLRKKGTFLTRMSETKEVIIRKALVDEWNECKIINELCLEENYTDAQWRSLFSEHSMNMFAIVGEKVVGYICWFRYMFKDGMHVVSLAVHPEYRRQGIATKLFEQSFIKLRETCPDRIHLTLHVRKSNKAAITLYTKRGFVPIKTETEYYKKPVEDALLMYKKLS